MKKPQLPSLIAFAGRAIEKRMFPLTFAELGQDYSLQEILSYGCLPDVILNRDLRINILETYVGTYLRQEIQQETMVNDVAAFHRFLQVAAATNGTILNMSNISRDAGVHRNSVQRYFDILVDTFIGYRLPAFQPKLKVRERGTPKFYLFDTGVTRTLANRLRDPLHETDQGILLETHLLHELRAAISYRKVGGDLFYWQTASGREVDFIWKRGGRAFGVEVKAAATWRRTNNKGLKDLLDNRVISKAYGVYRGTSVLSFGDIKVLPVEECLRELHFGDIFEMTPL